eukprot:2083213-Rhodomonas_salina.2
MVYLTRQVSATNRSLLFTKQTTSTPWIPTTVPRHARPQALEPEQQTPDANTTSARTCRPRRDRAERDSRPTTAGSASTPTAATPSLELAWQPTALRAACARGLRAKR